MNMMVNPFMVVPSGGGIPSYRYYYVEFLTTGNGYIAASTVKCLDSGGTDHGSQANGGTASVIGYTANGSFPVTNVNDGNDTSFTTSSGANAGSGKGIQIDLGSVEAIVSVQLRNRSDGSGGNEAIRTGNIYGKVNSGDGWTLIRAINEAWTQQNNELREFPFVIPSSASSTDWRIAMRSAQSGGTFIYCRELELRESSGGADTTTGQTATGSAFTPANAIDDTYGTFWGGGAVGQWLGVNHGASKTITHFSWQIHDVAADGPKGVTVLYKNANSAWVAWKSPTDIVWTTGNQTQQVTI